MLNDYGKKNGILKEGDNVSGEDVREGLTAVISVKLTDAQFEGQTKAKLGNTYMRALVDDRLRPAGSIWRRTPRTASAILEKAMTANRAREAAARRARGSAARPCWNRRQMPDKLRGLQRAQTRAERNLHRRGRLRRRLGHAGPRPPLPGDSAAVGQDAQRRKGPRLDKRSTATTSSSP